jgi:hypothetical protein
VRQSYGGRSEIMNAGKKKKRSRRGTEESSSISGRRSGRSSLKSLPSCKRREKRMFQNLGNSRGRSGFYKNKKFKQKGKKEEKAEGLIWILLFVWNTLQRVLEKLGTFQGLTSGRPAGC